MQLKTILNLVQKHKSFVYSEIRWLEEKGRPALEIRIKPRKGSRPICSVCSRPAAGYDTLAPRRFEFIPFWGIAVFFLYAMRRVCCPVCGIKVEDVPWGEGKSPICTAYAWFLARWAKRLAWSQVATAFHTSWHHVAVAVGQAV